MKRILTYTGTVFFFLMCQCSSNDQQQTDEDGVVSEDGQDGNKDSEDGLGDDKNANQNQNLMQNQIQNQSTSSAQQAQGAAAMSNTFQAEKGKGEGINNALGNDFATQSAAQAPAIDTSVTQAPLQSTPETPTFMPGTVPAGWAVTQNGLFVNLKDLTDRPTNYQEPPATWR